MAENHKPIRVEETEESGNGRAKPRARKASHRRVSGQRVLNVFDLFVILLILLVVVLLAVGVRFGDLFGTEQGKTVRLTYTMLLTDVDESFADAIAVGDVVRDVDTGVVLGTVRLAPTTEDYRVVGLTYTTTVDENGKQTTVATPEMKRVPGRINICVELATNATYMEESGYSIEGRTVRIGDAYAVRFPSYVGDAVCASITDAIEIKK